METVELVSFLRHRALVERQMGTNQMLSGADSGKWRLDRANNYDGCADALSQLECQIVNLKTEIANLKKK